MQMPIESMNLMLLNVGYAQQNADWNWQNVNSPFTRIYYVTEGEALLHLPDHDVRLRPGYMYTIPAYTVHSYECHGVFAHYYLHIYEGFKNDMNIQEVYELPTEIEGTKMDVHLLEFLCNRLPDASLPSSNPDSYDTTAQTSGYIQRYLSMSLWEKMELRGAMLMLVSHFIQQGHPCVWTNDDRTKRVLEYIHTHISESINIETLANVGCVTKSYLIKLFKRDFGTSPIQYINKKKVERAQLLLFTTDKTVKEIAFLLGFGDQNYFVRLFRKVTDMTPQEYRHSKFLNH